VLRGGLIGVGNVAVHGHLPGWRRRADARIVAVTDARPERRAAAAAALPGARWHDSPAALIAAEALDFVDVCTPPDSHAALAEAALRRGLHVLCEKPLVLSPAGLPPLVALATAGGCALHTVHNWHHAPIVRRATALLADGAVGRIARATWQTLRQRPAAAAGGGAANWRVDPAVAGGGVLTDHGWHVFYLLARWLGDDVEQVAARLETRRHREWAVEDTATVSLRFGGGAVAEVFLTWAADTRATRAAVHGGAGSLLLEDDALVLVRGGRTERWPCPPALSDGSQHPDRFDPVADAFVRAARARQPAGPNLAEAELCVLLLDLARESSRRGGATLPCAGRGATAAGSPRDAG
jgi:predicted dehydrogenase